jgi:MOSC domain-containing protein YiiM
MQTIAERMDILPQVGRVAWIGLSPIAQGEIQPVQAVEAIVDHGLAGDHHAKRTPGTKRQVTLIQQEHVVAVGGLLHQAPPDPTLLRRNVVVAGLNLLALKGRRFRIGAALLEYTGLCEPCSRMETNLGPGGFNAMRGHGGITARVIEGGPIRVGDPVTALPLVTPAYDD